MDNMNFNGTMFPFHPLKPNWDEDSSQNYKIQPTFTCKILRFPRLHIIFIVLQLQAITFGNNGSLFNLYFMLSNNTFYKKFVLITKNLS
jgi:hypothetical protein